MFLSLTLVTVFLHIVQIFFIRSIDFPFKEEDDEQFVRSWYFSGFLHGDCELLCMPHI